MQIDDIMPATGKYLKAADLRGQSVTVNIQNVAVETMRDNSQKPVVYFTGKEKGMTLNVTNKNAIVALYGQETDNWIGKPLILFSMMVDYQGQTVNGVRVRAPDAPAANGGANNGGEQYRSSPGPQATPAAQPAAGNVTDPNDEIPF